MATTENKLSYVNESSSLLDEAELFQLSRKEHALNAILRSLAYEAHGLRFIILVFLTILSFLVVERVWPNLLTSNPSMQIMLLGFVGSVLLSIDTFIFGSARAHTRRAMLEAYGGDFASAKASYRRAMRTLVSPPKDIYLLSIAEVFALENNLALSDRYIAHSGTLGASRRVTLFYALRSRLFSNNLNVDDILYLKEEIDNDPILQIELAWSNLSKEKYREALEISREILSSSSILHPSGIETRDQALLVQSLAYLFLGKSEEALIDLSFSLPILKAELNALPNLVPYLSLAYLLRAKYYSRRKDSLEKAEADRTRAMSLCRYPLHLSLGL